MTASSHYRAFLLDRNPRRRRVVEIEDVDVASLLERLHSAVYLLGLARRNSAFVDEALCRLEGAIKFFWRGGEEKAPSHLRLELVAVEGFIPFRCVTDEIEEGHLLPVAFVVENLGRIDGFEVDPAVASVVSRISLHVRNVPSSSRYEFEARMFLKTGWMVSVPLEIDSQVLLHADAAFLFHEVRRNLVSSIVDMVTEGAVVRKKEEKGGPQQDAGQAAGADE